jgi:hypothetical protein
MRRLSELIGATTLQAYADLGNLIATERRVSSLRCGPRRSGLSSRVYSRRRPLWPEVSRSPAVNGLQPAAP